MQFHSTNNKNVTAAFHEAILQRTAPRQRTLLPGPHPHAPTGDLDGR